MVVPSRAFVGVVVFGLITVLAIVPYTMLVLQGYAPPPDAPHKLLFPDPDDRLGLQVFLVLSSLFCVAFLIVSWRSLLRGARRDAARRRRHDELKRQMRDYQQQRVRNRPPPFN